MNDHKEQGPLQQKEHDFSGMASGAPLEELGGLYQIAPPLETPQIVVARILNKDKMQGYLVLCLESSTISGF